jgi:hypothetical protein
MASYANGKEREIGAAVVMGSNTKLILQSSKHIFCFVPLMAKWCAV